MSEAIQKAAPISTSEWDYCPIKELSAALESRQISASELLEHTIARIEALDGRLNAVVVRDFERARETARAADTALGKGERRALLGIPQQLSVCLRPQLQSTDPLRACLSGCKLSDLTWAIARRSCSLSCLSGSLADSCRLGNRRLMRDRSMSAVGQARRYATSAPWRIKLWHPTGSFRRSSAHAFTHANRGSS